LNKYLPGTDLLGYHFDLGFWMSIIVKFIDLQKQYHLLRPDMDVAIQTVLDHGQYIMGPEVRAFEVQLAKFVGVSHGIGASSGTTALQMALMALDVGPGDEVITTPFSFFATVEVIMLLGAKPIYVDIDPRTCNMDPALIEAAITPRTKAIMPVSLFGQTADFDAINAIAERYNLPVVEDAAQSLGATYKGRPSGSLSTISCVSFFPSKPLGCYGDGGACFTNDGDLAEKLRLIVNHGQSSRYHHTMIGINGRLDTIQAAILLVKLKNFPEEIILRQKVADQYKRYLSDLADQVITPYIAPDHVSAYAQYTIQVENRDAVKAALTEVGIPTAIHYPKGLHQQPASAVPGGNRFPVTEAIAKRVLSLPFYPYMTESDIVFVAENTARVLCDLTV